MAITKLNSLAIPPNTITESDLTYPLTNFSSTGIDDNANQSALLLDSVGYATLVHSQQTTGEGLSLQNLNTNLSVGTAITFELPVVGTGTEASIDYKNTGSASDFQLNLGVGSISSRVSDMTLNSSGEIIFGTFSSERMRISNTGGVTLTGDLYVDGGDAYIGQNNSETGNLTLYGPASGNEGAQLNFHPTGTYTGTFAIDVYDERLRFLNGLTNGTFQWYTAGNAGIGMEMASDGNVSLPHDGANINFGGETYGGPHGLNFLTDDTGGAIHWGLYYRTSPDTITLELDGTDKKLLLNTTGELHIDNDVIAFSTTTSDIRFKDDVETIDSALDKVMALRGVEYTWNATARKGERDMGLIAQEVEAVIPIIVREKTLSTGEWSDNPTPAKTVDYEKLTAVLIEAVKELKAEVDALKGGQ